MQYFSIIRVKIALVIAAKKITNFDHDSYQCIICQATGVGRGKMRLAAFDG